MADPVVETVKMEAIPGEWSERSCGAYRESCKSGTDS